MIDRLPFKNTMVSRLGLGTMRLPCLFEEKRESSGNIDYDKAQELVDIAYNNGVNYFDTAYMYHNGKSEEFIGHALKKYPRDSYYLADKLPIWMCNAPEDMEKVFNDQLKRCDVEYFDFYLLHSLDKNNFKKCEKFGAYEFVLQKQKEGKIKNIGFSFHGTVRDLKTIIKAHHWDFAQIQMNYLDWKNQNANEQYQILTDAGIPVIVMEPVRGGKLAAPGEDAEKLFTDYDSSSSVASWAIKFVATHSNVLTILSGMNNVEQMNDNINTLTNFVPFNDAQLDICFKAAKIINKADLIPCTGCDYCADCPKGVKISEIFATYNKYKSGKASLRESKKLYNEIEINHHECVNCGKCKTHCPQNINIPGWLNDGIAKLFQ